MMERVSAAAPDLPGPDLADPHLATDGAHFALWSEARRTRPVAWVESPAVGGFWSVTGHAEGGEAVKRPDVLVSSHGMRLGAPEAAVRAASGRMLVVSDGADHRRLRAAHQRWFGGRALSEVESALTDHVTGLLDELLATDAPFDVLPALTSRIPTWVLLRMLGVPEEDGPELTRSMAVAFDEARSGPEGEAERARAHTEIFGYFAELVDLRRACPAQDVVSALVAGDAQGRPFTDDETLLNCDGLMNGGLETTPHALAGAILAFARDPAAWARLRSEPALLDDAVEEVLRWTSPAMHAMRTAVTDTTLGGVPIRAGDRVVVWYPSCNRDERVFEDPDAFRPDRRPNPHIAFGAGPHYCVGATLARTEIRVLLRALAARVAHLEVAGEVRRRPSVFLQGWERMVVRMTPDRRAR